MNNLSSLLDALASPPPRKAPAARSKGSADKENLYSSEVVNDEQYLNTIPVAKEAPERQSDSMMTYPAVLLAVTSPDRPAGRMEILRVLIEEGKKAATEGRLATALRKYQTAMVTLPEAYKPRLQRKISRLEGQLRRQASSQTTPPRHSRARAHHAAAAAKEYMDPAELLHAAVQDVGAANSFPEGRAGAEKESRPLQSSPIAPGLRTPTHSSEPRLLDEDRDPDKPLAPTRPQSRADSGEDDGQDESLHSRGAVETHDCSAPAVNDVQEERLRVLNKDLSSKLEKQVVDIVNRANIEELVQLHGIGAKRAQHIIEKREESPFKTLGDLKRIGMYQTQIDKMGRRNMLARLELFRAWDDL